MAKSVSCTESNIQGVDGQTFIYGNTTNVEHTIADLADTISWICPNTTGSAAEAPKLAFPNDPSYWHRPGARPKASTPSRTWADVTRRKGKSSRKSVKRAPMLTPPLELSLQNRYDALAPNEMCDNSNYTEPREANHTCGIKAIQNASNSPKTTARPRARKNYANSTPEKPRARRSIANTTPDQPDTILIGDSITKHVRMAKTENLTVSDTTVTELTELLPVIPSTPPSNMRIIIHAGSFDILRRKTGSEILKKDFPAPGETEWLSVTKCVNFWHHSNPGERNRVLYQTPCPEYMDDIGVLHSWDEVY
ncbi:hypothetical protein ABVT39_012305 [Epinephelus coioides]